MRRISAYFISLLIFLPAFNLIAQDTVLFPLKLRAGIDIAGPVINFSDRNNLSMEGYVSFDRSEKMAYVIEVGYLDYNFSQYNYDYTSKGVFARLGVDFNLLKPEVSLGKYWAGIGLRYGISLFSSATPSFQQDNYWGSVTSSIPSKKTMGHYFEVAPGVKTEIFRNFSIGWTIRLKLLLSGGGGRDLRPIYLPGYGNGGKQSAAGISYFISWNIHYKTKTVITKPEVPEEPDVTVEDNNSGTQQIQSFR